MRQLTDASRTAQTYHANVNVRSESWLMHGRDRRRRRMKSARLHCHGVNCESFTNGGTHVALTHLNLEGHLRPLSELGSYTVEKGDQDPRGWTVVTGQGTRIGEVEDLIVDTQAMKVRYLVVDLENGTEDADGDRRVLLTTESVQLRDAQREVVATQYGARGFEANTGAHAYTRPTAAGTDRKTLTRSEEE